MAKSIRARILGAERVLCYSLRAERAIAQKYGGMQGLMKSMESGDELEIIDAISYALWALMDAGARYAKMEGIENPPAPELDDILDGLDLRDIAEAEETITAAINAGSAQAVAAESSKNVAATPGV